MRQAPVLGTPGLWFAALGGATAYAAHLVIGFWLVPVACESGTVLWLHALGAVTLTTAMVAAVQAVLLRAAAAAPRTRGGRQRTRVGLASAQALAGDPGRVRFMATVGLALNLVAVLLIITHWAPVAFFDPCR